MIAKNLNRFEEWLDQLIGKTPNPFRTAKCKVTACDLQSLQGAAVELAVDMN